MSEEQGKLGGLIQSSSVKDRETLWKTEHVFNVLLIFPPFAFYFAITSLLLCRQLVNVQYI